MLARLFALLPFLILTSTWLAAAPGWEKSNYRIVGRPPLRHPEPITVEIITTRYEYRPGDPIRLQVRMRGEGQIFVFGEDRNGTVRQLLPNGYDRGNFLRDGDVKYLPTSRFRLTASTEGFCEFHVIAIGADPTQFSAPSWLGRPGPRDGFPIVSGGLWTVREELRRAARRGHFEVSDSSTSIRVRGNLPSHDWNPPTYWNPDPHDDPPRDHCADQARLILRSSPSGAEVFVDGNCVGRTPLNVELKAGRREIRVSRPGYETWERCVSLEKGAVENYSIRLRPNARPIRPYR